jgi:hypothetical protein
MAAPQCCWPTASLGLAPIVVRQVFAKRDEVRKAGVTVLVVGRMRELAEIRRLSLRAEMQARGHGRGPRDVRRSTSLIDAYLGAQSHARLSAEAAPSGMCWPTGTARGKSPVI